ncbi:DnaD domain protein [Erysipelothrix aquatica]|uniref:DnaD domain protein n=1 Tax=Erysipelothrix aquatica TaxID=2683714 RepID=UPI0013576D91|nr:DnaD domain protein [Erysipelothrix aquatica]
MWWNKSYINRRDWILENMSTLKVTPNQVVVLLLIDFLNEQNIAISLEVLAEQSGMSVQTVDEVMHDLMRQKMLAIKVENESIRFIMDGLFQDGVAYEYVNQSIFEVFESEFGRLLSQPELVMLNNWMKQYTEADILDALRNAMVYKKVSMNYINTILANKQKEKQG